jgi:hypothetical protein
MPYLPAWSFVFYCYCLAAKKVLWVSDRFWRKAVIESERQLVLPPVLQMIDLQAARQLKF